MPHTPSALKTLKQDVGKRLRNRSAKSALKTQLKRFSATLQAGDVEAVREQFRLTVKLLDHTASRGIINKGTVSRKKSQLAQGLNKLVATGGEKKK